MSFINNNGSLLMECLKVKYQKEELKNNQYFYFTDQQIEGILKHLNNINFNGDIENGITQIVYNGKGFDLNGTPIEEEQ